MPPEIAVIGAGTMGAGIAQLALEHGHEVRLVDVDPAGLERAQARIADGLGRRLSRRGMAGPDLDSTRAGILERLSLGTAVASVERAAVVIEAVVEQLAVKQELVERLDRLVAADAILATNTSALSVGAIASAATLHPERVVGLHFFNPAPLMPLVEVVAGRQTANSVVEAAAALVTGWDLVPVRCADRPGFVVNRVNRPFTIQALRSLEAAESDIGLIDQAIRDLGFPLGPFELMDLVGIDVNLAAATGVWEGFDQARRFRPSPIQEALVAAGRLGRKTGEGFYRYDQNGRRLGPGPGFESAPGATDNRSAAIAERIRMSIASEAFRALDEGVAADESTIDLALRLGANHPEGPFVWARARGLANVLAYLESMPATDSNGLGPPAGLRRAIVANR